MKTQILCLYIVLASSIAGGNDELDLLNAQRVKIGLPAFAEDPELVSIAVERLAANVARGDWRHHKRGGRMIGRFAPARAEGCGNVGSDNRWYTCFWRSKKYSHAGAAMVKVRGRYWQLLLLR